MGIELLDVSELYPTATMAAALSALQADSRPDCAQLKTRILSIAGWLNASLHYRHRPAASEKRAALKQFAEQMTTVLRMLDKIDSDTHAEIEQAARADTRPEVHPRMDAGRTRVHMAVDLLGKLLEWTEGAERSLAADKPGRTKLDDEREAIQQLLSLWCETHPIGPTNPQLLALVHAALDPVLHRLGLSLNLMESARNFLPTRENRYALMYLKKRRIINHLYIF